MTSPAASGDVISIRGSLVTWLITALGLGLVAALVGTYVLTRGEVAAMFDEELRQVASAVLLREDWIMAGRIRIARPGFYLAVRAYNRDGRKYFETRLPTLPEDLPHSQVEGFSTRETSDGEWRVFTHVTEDGIVQVGQPRSARDELARAVSFRALLPMLLLIPFLAGVGSWALTRALAPLYRTSRLVAVRDAKRLDPLSLAQVPRELVPLVEEINGLMARLAETMGANRRFLADAAHGLRSPIAALSLQIELAERAASAAERREAFQEAALGVARVRRLIQQLLDHARLEHSPAAPMVRTDLGAVARQVVAECAVAAERRGIDLGADVKGASWVDGNPAELRSLIENLVDNALRYAPKHSAVTVAVAPAEGFVELSVTDAGPGIAPLERARVFERFQRASGDATAGTGLGLAIVRTIANRHGATVSIDALAPAAEPPGTCVKARFPRSASAPVSSAL